MEFINKYEDVKKYLEVKQEIENKVAELIKERVYSNTTLIDPAFNWTFNTFYLKDNLIHINVVQGQSSVWIGLGIDLLYTTPLKIAV
jgi:hypothetical protein